MKVVIDSSFSELELLRFGVSQGSCARPVIFTMYIAALNTILNFIDMLTIIQWLLEFKNKETVIQQVSECLKDIISYMTQRKG